MSGYKTGQLAINTIRALAIDAIQKELITSIHVKQTSI
jgi:hypothetical protein